MKKMTLSAILLSSAFSLSAFAAHDCPKYPKEEWMKEADLKKKLEDEGYTIKKFKIDGDCYEIYGWKNKGSKEEQKVEIYFDMKTGAPLKTKVNGKVVSEVKSG